MMRRPHENVIEYITTNTEMRQTDLAEKLGVSRAQISKWKAGEYIPHDRQEQLMNLAGLFDTVCTRWAIFAGTENNANAWYEYLLDILNDSEWAGALAELYSDAPDIYTSHVIETLQDLDATLPQTAPTTRWEDEENSEPTPLAGVLFELLDNWAQIFAWVNPTFWFDDCSNDAECELFDQTQDLEWHTFDLGLTEVAPERLTNIGINLEMLNVFMETTRKTIEDRLHSICQTRIKHGLPITADYFQLLHLTPTELAEQSWSFSGTDRDAIRGYLPYGQQLILSQLQLNAMSLNLIYEKLE